MSTKDLTFHRITLPIFVQMSLLVVIFLTDTFFLSRISDAAVAGVGGIIPLLLTSIALMHAFSDSGTSILAQAIGAKRQDRMMATFIVMLIICFILGLALSIAQAALSSRIGHWLGFAPEAAEASRLYLLYLVPLFVLDALFINFNSVLFAYGQTQWNMYAAISSAGTNLLINLLLLYEVIPGWTLGPREVALSTIAAQFPPIAIMGLAVFKRLGLRLSVRGIGRSEFVWSAKRILSIGGPAILEPLSYNVSQLFMYGLLATVGTAAVAAFTYGKNIFILLSTAGGLSIGIGTQIIVGHLQGERDFEGAGRRVKRSLIVFLPIAVLVIGVVNLASEPVVGLFTSDHSVLEMTQTTLLFMFVVEPMRMANYIVYPSLRGSGDVMFPVGMSVVAHWVTGVSLAWLLGIHMELGMVGVLSGIAADELFRGIVNFTRWNSRRWEHYLIAEGSESAA
jgi:putative MATE family efflux protein